MKPLRNVLIKFLILVVMLTSPAAAQSIQFGELKEYVDFARDMTDAIVLVINTLSNVSQDDRATRAFDPGIMPYSWEALAAKFDQLAVKIEQAPLPTEFDASQYQVSVEELLSCPTQGPSINKLNSLAEELEKTKVDAQDYLNDLQNLENNLRAIGQEIIKLSDLMIHLNEIFTPFQRTTYTSYFQQFEELDGNVTRALGELQTVVVNHRQKLASELAKLEQRLSFLKQNLEWVNGLSSCALVETYEGVCNWGGETSNVNFVFDSNNQLTIVIPNGKLYEYVDENGQRKPLGTVTAYSANVVINRFGQLTGQYSSPTLSADGRSEVDSGPMKGSFSQGFRRLTVIMTSTVFLAGGEANWTCSVNR